MIEQKIFGLAWPSYPPFLKVFFVLSLPVQFSPVRARGKESVLQNTVFTFFVVVVVMFFCLLCDRSGNRRLLFFGRLPNQTPLLSLHNKRKLSNRFGSSQLLFAPRCPLEGGKAGSQLETMRFACARKASAGLPTVALATHRRWIFSSAFFEHPEMSDGFKEIMDEPLKPILEGVRTHQLPNGARVIAHNRGGPIAHVGVYVEAGALYDPPDLPGLNYVMRHAISRCSNMNDSAFAMDRTCRSCAVSSSHCEVEKRYLGWKIEGRVDTWQQPFAQLLTSITSPRFPDHEIDMLRDSIDATLEERRWKTPRDYVVDQLESTAFTGEVLGNPRFIRPSVNDVCTSHKLLQHWNSAFRPSSVVVAALNADIDEIIAAYLNAPLQHSATAPHHASAPMLKLATPFDDVLQFHGKRHAVEHEQRALVMGTVGRAGPEAIAAFGWCVPGRHLNPASYANSLVLQQLADIAMGDSVRYDRGEIHHGLRTFYRSFGFAGLVGATARCDPKDLLPNLSTAYKAFCTAGDEDAMLPIAIEHAILRYYHDNIEYPSDYLNTLATSFAVKDAMGVYTYEEVVDALQQVTVKSIKETRDTALQRGGALFVTGDVPALQSASLADIGL